MIIIGWRVGQAQGADDDRAVGGWRILNTLARLRVPYLESLASPALFYSG